MIRVTIGRRPSDGTISFFRIEGHAFYDEPGKDLVCAAVSAISVGTVNAVEQVAGAMLPCEMEDGLIDASVPLELDGRQAERVQLLLEAMVVMLNTIETSYGEYIQIDTEGG
ncbi:ribosomal protein [Gordoniibacillus kamchatkensis]|uniref:Ribosomal processing cysteine protease Prp n=1 Tax=Gordoniibacillus kamchatkensis TaxID=1590651 RepID=A0ABR5AIY6_9BACL|nr:ribosomal-processing cysteine protease Prp [Paenibacillus sp. VKM B-2647]KIL41025.1 ribosomal protein [Paenibacillus sp. VKM B-2647]